MWCLRWEKNINRSGTSFSDETCESVDVITNKEKKDKSDVY